MSSLSWNLNVTYEYELISRQRLKLLMVAWVSLQMHTLYLFLWPTVASKQKNHDVSIVTTYRSLSLYPANFLPQSSATVDLSSKSKSMCRLRQRGVSSDGSPLTLQRPDIIRTTDDVSFPSLFNVELCPLYVHGPWKPLCFIKSSLAELYPQTKVERIFNCTYSLACFSKRLFSNWEWHEPRRVCNIDNSQTWFLIYRAHLSTVWSWAGTHPETAD